MKVLSPLAFPLLGAFVFATLLGALLTRPFSANQIFPVGIGLLVFSLMITEIIIALRLKCFERKLGLPLMYSIHGSMAIILFVAAVIHIILKMEGNFFALEWSMVSLTGKIGFFFLLLTMVTGMLVLSNTYIGKLRGSSLFKEVKFNREAGLWLHRLSVLAVLAIFGHMLSFRFVRSNTLLLVLTALYVLIAVGGYLAVNVSKRNLPKYILRNCIKHNSKVYELEFEPQNGKIMEYTEGQFVFVKFVNSELPPESHPFSLVSAPSAASRSLKIMVKKVGDYTGLFDSLKAGDTATLEGPYGNFIDAATAAGNNPLVFMAGGIGITPLLSILRKQMETDWPRKLVLIWGLTGKEDLLLLDELQDMQRSNGNFTYHITLSKEKAEPFAFGQISQEYLQQTGVSSLYAEADFFLCGPAAMMSALKKILVFNKVPAHKIHAEEFTF